MPVAPKRRTCTSLAECKMNEGDRGRAFTNRRGHALHVPCADVADRKDSGQGRLEEVGESRQPPARRREILLRQVGTGLDETPRIERDTALEPCRAGHRACHYEDVPYVQRLDGLGGLMPPAHTLEGIVALQGSDLRLR